jgi:hypothetical protein
LNVNWKMRNSNFLFSQESQNSNFVTFIKDNEN